MNQPLSTNLQPFKKCYIGSLLLKQALKYLTYQKQSWTIQFQLTVKTRVVESESGVGGVACFQLESESGVGVAFQNCWSRFFKTGGVGVGSRSRFFKTAVVGVRSRNICCNYRLQCLLNNLNYNINCLKIITGYWQY